MTSSTQLKHWVLGFLVSAGHIYAAQPGLGFFVYNHHTLLRSRLDPIITPGKVSGHTHVFAGANRVTADATTQSIMAANCTTAPITLDKSLYWAPQLYYKHEDGTYQAMSGDGLVTYWFYHFGKEGEAGLADLPADFRMVAGNMKRNSLDMTDPSHQAVSFQCFGPGYDMRLPYIPADFECQTIRPQIGFPNCWNGVDSYKADNSHVRYGVGNYEYGDCGDWKRIPQLFLEAYYRPAAMIGPKYKWRPGCLVFAHGDNFGLTFHADWLNGFPAGALKKIYTECKTTLDGTVGSCPYLKPYITSEEARHCKAENSHIVNEVVGISAPVAKLPGNNAEYNSSALANKPKANDPNYVDKGKLVAARFEDGGLCYNQQCTDWHGPADAPQVVLSGAPAASGTEAPSQGTTASGPVAVIASTGGPVLVPASASSSGAVPPAGSSNSQTPPAAVLPPSSSAPGIVGAAVSNAVEVVIKTIFETVYVTGTAAAAAPASSTVRCNRKRMTPGCV